MAGSVIYNTTIYIKNIIEANLLHVIPLHGVVLQSVASVLFPSHSFPPLRGTGALHSLVLTFRPPPQLAVHCPTVLHCPQPPSTTEKNGNDLFSSSKLVFKFKSQYKDIDVLRFH